MAIRANKSELLQLLGAESRGQTSINFEGLEVDSRQIKGGELFIALKGELTHGHSFVQQAYDRGCALILVEDVSLLETFADPERLLFVPDTLKAFHKLANWWRRKLQLPVLAVTGSVGKTTTKELLAGILLQHSLGSYARLSLNNHVGVPYTICQADSKHHWQVLEMGMNHSGEIEQLSLMAEPDVSMVLKIGAAHIGLLGSLEKIAEAKLEIIAGLKPEGTLIVNADDPVLQSGLSAKKALLAERRVLSFGEADRADLKIHRVSLNDSLHLQLEVDFDGTRQKLESKIIGMHNAYNVAAAVIAAKTLLADLTWQQIQAGLLGFAAPDGRLKVRILKPGRVLIDDAYNANPTSMSAMLQIAKELSEQGGRVGLFIGDMLALGDLSQKYHQDLAESVIAAKPAFVLTCGQEIKATEALLRAAGLAVTAVETPESAANLLHKLEFNYLLVKASHDIGLHRTVAKLLEIEGELMLPQPLDQQEK